MNRSLVWSFPVVSDRFSPLLLFQTSFGLSPSVIGFLGPRPRFLYVMEQFSIFLRVYTNPQLNMAKCRNASEKRPKQREC